MSFTLKLLEKKDGWIEPDTRHEMGGTDSEQFHAFLHLTRGAYIIAPLDLDELDFLARLHGWNVTLEASSDE